MSNHVVMHDGSVHPFGFECLHCRQFLPIALPVSVDVMLAASEDFARRHARCQVIEAPEAQDGAK